MTRRVGAIARAEAALLAALEAFIAEEDAGGGCSTRLADAASSAAAARRVVAEGGSMGVKLFLKETSLTSCLLKR